jgi:hypothetical protein
MLRGPDFNSFELIEPGLRPGRRLQIGQPYCMRPMTWHAVQSNSAAFDRLTYKWLKPEE